MADDSITGRLQVPDAPVLIAFKLLSLRIGNNVLDLAFVQQYLSREYVSMVGRDISSEPVLK